MHVETLTRGLTISDPADVATYKDTFAQLRKLAVTGADAQSPAKADHFGLDVRVWSL